MPELSRFYGLIIFMNYRDHNPPHFHAWYGDYKIIVTIEKGIIEGKMPKRALKMLFDWLEMHKEELMENWELARAQEPLKKIEPLP